MPSIVSIFESVVDDMKELPVDTFVNQAATVYEVTFEIRRPHLFVGAEVVVYYDGGQTVYGTITQILTNKLVYIQLETAIDERLFESLELVLQFLHGHLIDIQQNLIQQTNDPDYKGYKFPLVILPQDIPEPGSAGFESEPTPTAIICIDTRNTFDAAERYDNSFDNILYPLANMFLEKLELSPYVFFRKRAKEWIDRLYWGRESAEGTDANKLTDYIDGIELRDLEIKVLQTC